jgi:hypothetical protein
MPKIDGYSIYANFVDDKKEKIEFQMYRDADDILVYSSGIPKEIFDGLDDIYRELKIEARRK